MGIYEEDDGTKIYTPKTRDSEKRKVIPYTDNDSSNNDYISVFVLYHDKNQRLVKNMQEKLDKKKIVLVKGLAETDIAYDEKIDVLNNFDYMVVMVSKVLLEDLELLNVLVENYEIKGKNKKIIPMIVWKELYESEVKAQVLEELDARIVKYREQHFDDDFGGNVADELKRMQKIYHMLQDFLKTATEKDRKTNLSAAEKLLKYIRYERGVSVPDTDEKGNYEIHNILNIHDGGQVNIAKDNATINTIQNNKE